MSKFPSVDIAVIPVAGLGTRFLPITKATPKEMLPLVNKPLIQYVIDEAYSAGIREIILVTAFGKQSIENYFDRQHELEYRLKQLGKDEALEQVRSTIPKDLNIAYIRQPEPKGLGDAVLCAKPLVGDRPFAVLLADDIFLNDKQPGLAQLIEKYNMTGASCVGVAEVPKEQISSYGVVAADSNGEISAMVEKPQPEDAPSNLAIVGRYVFTANLFNYLDSATPGVGGEVQITDSMDALRKVDSMYAVALEGVRLDCGVPESHFMANLRLTIAAYPHLKADALALLESL
jgi:UTP--glucose-1-phosphate uridylyltransferase